MVEDTKRRLEAENYRDDPANVSAGNPVPRRDGREEAKQRTLRGSESQPEPRIRHEHLNVELIIQREQDTLAN